ncbi:MAG: BlaI/MecI/CopY family transcriptional regulator [Chitinophagaceae bacterium]|jgi:predicted transcriptional regulator|nr:BlaI/MecI/CopY family transcriptional regulator [Chitinophagaceae bacterium]MBP6047217.1 BlaI/MecI/CopY family transcriptional regulator [Ferruginibacter sp.]NMD28500.1 BlaI/MecI/CopY family transcriptional regulator [Bacteroidota bacterium]MBK7346962.1 BlaI/MecI/CopY family transcriptional regulator [Chitinophagaceae bacterium]MBK7735126.1 BlaI/MecI/CopY family transcriptional regulator [Chitinophagaceae bacterium]
MNTQAIPRPTESELEILSILWKYGKSSVRTVHDEISKTKPTGYTTTLKFMQIMLDKKLLTRDSSCKVHVYEPAVSREKTQKQLVSKMVNSLFSGSPAQLVLQALGSCHPSNEELIKIEELLKELKTKK